jgi:hypothetical protein
MTAMAETSIPKQGGNTQPERQPLTEELAENRLLALLGRH